MLVGTLGLGAERGALAGCLPGGVQLVERVGHAKAAAARLCFGPGPQGATWPQGGLGARAGNLFGQRRRRRRR